MSAPPPASAWPRATFSPTTVAIGGVIGAVPGGSTLRGAVAIGAATGAGETVLGSVLTGQGFPSPQQLALGTVLGGAGGGAGHGITTRLAPVAQHSATTARLQAHVDNAVADFESGAIAMSPRQAAAGRRQPEPRRRVPGIGHRQRQQGQSARRSHARRLGHPQLRPWPRLLRPTQQHLVGHDHGPSSWPRHVDQYTPTSGAGTQLPTELGPRPAGGLYVWEGRLTRGV